MSVPALSAEHLAVPDEHETGPALPPTDEHLVAPDGYNYTDLGNAKRLIRGDGQFLRYVPAWNKWLIYAGGRWRVDEQDVMTAQLVGRLGRALLTPEHIDAVMHNEKALKRLIRHAKYLESRSGVDAAMRMARAVPGVAIDHERIDAHPWLLNVTNGTVDLLTGYLRAADPRDLLMMTAATHYDPEAEAPRFTAFMARILPDEEVRSFVQRLLGMVLVGETLDHVLPIGIGGGANGKSTLTNIIAGVLGDYAVVTSRDLLLSLKHDNHPTMKADLFRRRFAHSGEIARDAQLDEAQVKELTGGDRISARRMREDLWSFAPSHTLWLHANYRPRIEGTDDAIWRRVLLIPFEVQVPTDERDPHLAASILREESAGVLRWMLDGLAEYQREGLLPPSAVTSATTEYRQQSDTIAGFLTECSIAFGAGLTISANDLMAMHGEWFAASGLVESEKAHYQRIVEKLKKEGATSHRGAQGRYWRNIGSQQ